MCPSIPPVLTSRCASCDTEFEQRSCPGLPSAYCGTACQWRDQRRRAKQRASLRDLDPFATVVQRLRALVEERADHMAAGAIGERQLVTTGRLATEAARWATGLEKSLPAGPGMVAFEAAVENSGRVLAVLHRAAGEPAPGTLAHATGLSPAGIWAALEGSWASAGTQTPSLARALDAHPGLVRSARERVHYRFLSTPDACPCAGLSGRRSSHAPWDGP
ncbi:hypothetical protein [Streptomyces zagrosensis]|uniref:Uncharacterized protein n=1 Tax=Streptomyces zagrosensis TaxID=1042984 RepID=A0A7W9V142_9ACTN|nr:hypothetical protein [Streptomyces zagrosensis]MBB5938552.1 hypothetical protein [Streptomyces zagrosensis]